MGMPPPAALLAAGNRLGPVKRLAAGG